MNKEHQSVDGLLVEGGRRPYIERQIERMVFRQCHFVFRRLTNQEAADELLAYMDTDAFGQHSHLLESMTLCCEDGYDWSSRKGYRYVLGQDWSCSILRACATQGISGGLVVVASDSVRDFLTQWVGRRLHSDFREYWDKVADEGDGQEVEVWLGVDWEEVDRLCRKALRETATEEFESEWDSAMDVGEGYDEEEWYSRGYDKACEGHGKFYMPRESSIRIEASLAHSAALDEKRRMESMGSYEDALQARLESLNLEE
jgi:hypothetical protein